MPPTGMSLIIRILTIFINIKSMNLEIHGFLFKSRCGRGKLVTKKNSVGFTNFAGMVVFYAII